MTKTLNQIIFFLHQNQNIFSATLGIRIFKKIKKKHNPRLQVKLSFPNNHISIMSIVGLLCYATLQCATIN
jgi:hypothetical protein